MWQCQYTDFVNIVKYSLCLLKVSQTFPLGTPWGSGYIWPYIACLIMIQIQYTVTYKNSPHLFDEFFDQFNIFNWMLVNFCLAPISNDHSIDHSLPTWEWMNSKSRRMQNYLCWICYSAPGTGTGTVCSFNQSLSKPPKVGFTPVMKVTQMIVVFWDLLSAMKREILKDMFQVAHMNYWWAK